MTAGEEYLNAAMAALEVKITDIMVRFGLAAKALGKKAVTEPERFLKIIDEIDRLKTAGSILAPLEATTVVLMGELVRIITALLEEADAMVKIS